MNRLSIKQINGNNFEIPVNENLEKHFGSISNYMFDAPNYAFTILKQIEEYKIYFNLFKGKKDLTVLDIGANIGLVAIHILPACKKLICIEPTPSHFELLQNITAGTGIECYNFAVSNKTGKQRFLLSDKNSTTNSLIEQKTHSDNIEVNTKTLSQTIDDLNLEFIDIIKMDIEGSEFLVLNDEEIKKCSDKVGLYYIETHAIGDKDHNFFKGIFFGLFSKHNYKINNLTYDSFIAFK